MYGENIFSDHYWENCTNSDYAPRIIKGIQRRLTEHSLVELCEKFYNRTLRILEVGSGNGEFLKALQNEGFQNIRGLDMNPRHMIKYPELDEIVDIDIIQRGVRESDQEKYDLVYTNLVFDEDCYREQRVEGCREAMIKGIHDSLDENGLYYGAEVHQREKIKSIIKTIKPRANSLVGTFEREFIPALK